jgi:hypothetical protein
VKRLTSQRYIMDLEKETREGTSAGDFLKDPNWIAKRIAMIEGI